MSTQLKSGALMLRLAAPAVVAVSLIFGGGIQIGNAHAYSTPTRVQVDGGSLAFSSTANNLITAGNAVQASAGTSGAVTQSHALSAGNATQASAGNSGAAAQSQQIVAGNATQANSGTAGAVTQSHALSAGNATHTGIGTSGGVTQNDLPALISDPDFVVTIEARNFTVSAARDFTVAIEARSFTA